MDIGVDDHDVYTHRATKLAEEAAKRGDDSFGSVLVSDGIIRMEESNRTQSQNGLALHPELTLAARPASAPSDCAKAMMDTSTEPSRCVQLELPAQDWE